MMCTTATKHISPADLADDNMSEEEGEVMEPSSSSMSNASVNFNSQRSSSSERSYRRVNSGNNYHSSSEYKRKFSEGSNNNNNSCVSGVTRKKLNFVPPLKKRTVEHNNNNVVMASSASDSVGSGRWGPRLARVEGTKAASTGGGGGRNTVLNSTLGNRFQPPPKNLKSTAHAKGVQEQNSNHASSHNNNIITASRWAPPRWDAPNNANTNAHPPPTVISTTSLNSIHHHASSSSTSDPHLPLKKRFHMESLSTPGGAVCDRLSDHTHRIVTTTEEEHSTTACEESVASLVGGMQGSVEQRGRGDLPVFVGELPNDVVGKRGTMPAPMKEKTKVPGLVVQNEQGVSKDQSFKYANLGAAEKIQPKPCTIHWERPRSDINSAGEEDACSNSSIKNPDLAHNREFTKTVSSSGKSLSSSQNSLAGGKKPCRIHIKLPKNVKSPSNAKSPVSPSKARIHIKLPKIAKSTSFDGSSITHNACSKKVSSPGSAKSQSSFNKTEQTQKLSETLHSKKEAYPSKLHVPSLTSTPSAIESKAQEILAKARMRLQTSLSKEGSKDQLKVHTPTSSKSELFHPAILSESPVSVPSNDSQLHDALGKQTAKVTAVLDVDMKKLVMRPEAVRIIHSEIHVPHEASASFEEKVEQVLPSEEKLPFSNPTSVKPESEIVSNTETNQMTVKTEKIEKKTNIGSAHESDFSTHTQTKPKKLKRLKKKTSTSKEKKSSMAAPTTHKIHAQKKKSSFDLTALLAMSDSSDSESSTDSSSSSSSCTSTSSSSSSSCSLSSTSSSSSSSDSGSSSECSSSSSDSDSDSDSDDSITSCAGKKQPSAKIAAKKTKRKYRRRSSTDVIMGPAPPKEQALTDSEVRKILQQDSSALGNDNSTWVRRSSRQPSKNFLNSASVKDLLNRLHCNDSDMVVLKMKKYLNDPNVPPLVMDAALDALEENSNCQALYIQNFNNAMKDDQMMHLLRILQAPKCRIWCLNIGETYNVSHKTWSKFAKGLKHTKVTHMYGKEK
eukprot:scaffold31160_cov73-Cyclotella_meneghiniana.AAC.15